MANAVVVLETKPLHKRAAAESKIPMTKPKLFKTCAFCGCSPPVVKISNAHVVMESLLKHLDSRADPWMDMHRRHRDPATLALVENYNKIPQSVYDVKSERSAPIVILDG